jgi:Cu+-exporting ATPase
MRKETLQISGMTCAACASAVERAVQKVDGVKEVSVNLATEKMTVDYDPAAATTEAIKAAVQKAGYEAREESNTKEATFPIEGMT